jgi:hypothetical protein
MARRVPILAALLLALVPGVARATTFYARAHGSESGTECPLGAECSLPHALSLTKDGDAVVLEPGAAYTPSAMVNVKHAIDIGGAPGAVRPTIKGKNGEKVLEMRSGARLHDVDLIGDEANVALEIEAGSVERVLAENTGISGGGCFIFDGTIVDSVCSSREQVGLEMAGVLDSFLVKLRNVTAVGGTYGLSVIGPEDPFETRLEAVNTIVRGGPGKPDVAVRGEGTTQVLFTTSDYAATEVSGAKGSATPAGTGGNIAAPPLFVDPGEGDFHQLPTSPTVDAGSTDTSLASLDLDGDPRALSAHPSCTSTAGPTDIGAYEYVAPVPTCAPPPGGGPPPTPAKPGVPQTRLKKARIDSAKGTATFTFDATESPLGFACKLLRPAPKRAGSSRAAMRPKAHFTFCHSPKTYRHLVPGAYTFKVISTAIGGSDATPAVRKFRIRAPHAAHAG